VSRNVTAKACLVKVKWPKEEYKALKQALELDDDDEELFTCLDASLIFETSGMWYNKRSTA
jgi:hypothetical protein